MSQINWPASSYLQLQILHFLLNVSKQFKKKKVWQLDGYKNMYKPLGAILTPLSSQNNNLFPAKQLFFLLVKSKVL